MNVRTLFRSAIAALLVATGLTVGVVGPARAGTANIVWPERTAFNPTLFEYAVTSSYPGEEQLYYTWGAEQPTAFHPLSSSGTTTLTFAVDGQSKVTVFACVGDPAVGGTCSDTGDQSPWLSVYRALKLGSNEPTVDDGLGRIHATLGVAPFLEPIDGVVPEAMVDVTMARHDTDLVVASSPETPQSIANGRTGYAIDVPDTVPNGLYDLHVHFQVDTGPNRYGPLAGDLVVHGLHYAGVLPTIVLRHAYPTFFPYPDGYRDSEPITVASDESGLADLDVLNGQGTVVRQLLSDRALSAGVAVKTSWDGRNAQGVLVAPGLYSLRLRVTDSAGNRVQRIVLPVVSDKKLVTKTLRKTVGAAASMIGKFVGACSTLKNPGPRWAGSLAYLSNTRCKGGKTDSSYVQTYHSISVPKAFEGRYKTLQASGYGGPAKGWISYFATAWITPGNDAVGWKDWTSKVGSHPGATVNAKPLIFSKNGRTYVVWLGSAYWNNRYEVKNYTVKLTYQVLQ